MSARSAKGMAVGLALVALIIYVGYIAWIGVRF